MLVVSVVNMFCYFVVCFEMFDEELMLLCGDYLMMSVYELIGVIVVIMLWNLLIVFDV